jgi:hypothetical protein
MRTRSQWTRVLTLPTIRARLAAAARRLAVAQVEAVALLPAKPVEAVRWLRDKAAEAELQVLPVRAGEAAVVARAEVLRPVKAGRAARRAKRARQARAACQQPVLRPRVRVQVEPVPVVRVPVARAQVERALAEQAQVERALAEQAQVERALAEQAQVVQVQAARLRAVVEWPA